jgi:HEAT repeat protein
MAYFSPVHRWVRQIRDNEDSPRRYEAAYAAFQGKVAGLSPELAVKALVLALDDPGWRVRETALFALGRLATKVPGARDAILKRLDDPEAMVRAAAVRALGERGDAAAIVLPAIRSRLKDRSVYVRLSAMGALGGLIVRGGATKVGGEGEQADPSVIALLNEAAADREAKVRVEAAFWLAVLGAEEATVRPILAAAKDSPNPALRSSANLGRAFLGDLDVETLRSLRDLVSLRGPSNWFREKASTMYARAQRLASPELWQQLDDVDVEAFDHNLPAH